MQNPIKIIVGLFICSAINLSADIGFCFISSVETVCPIRGWYRKILNIKSSIETIIMVSMTGDQPDIKQVVEEDIDEMRKKSGGSAVVNIIWFIVPENLSLLSNNINPIGDGWPTATCRGSRRVWNSIKIKTFRWPNCHRLVPQRQTTPSEVCLWLRAIYQCEWTHSIRIDRILHFFFFCSSCYAIVENAGLTVYRTFCTPEKRVHWWRKYLW